MAVRPGQSLWSVAESADPDADTRVVIRQIIQLNALAATPCSRASGCGYRVAEIPEPRPETPSPGKVALGKLRQWSNPRSWPGTPRSPETPENPGALAHGAATRPDDTPAHPPELLSGQGFWTHGSHALASSHPGGLR